MHNLATGQERLYVFQKKKRKRKERLYGILYPKIKGIMASQEFEIIVKDDLSK